MAVFLGTKEKPVDLVPARPALDYDYEDESDYLLDNSAIEVIEDVRQASFYSSRSKGTGEWDVFRSIPPLLNSFAKGSWYNACLQILRLLSYPILFIVTLTSAVLTRISFLLMVSAIGWMDKNMTICGDKVPESSLNEVTINKQHVVKWVWAVFIALCAPELVCFIHSFHRSFFRHIRRPTLAQFSLVFFIESLQAIGIGILVFGLLPDLDSITGAMLSNSIVLIPCILTLFSRRTNKSAIFLISVDILCVIVQSIAVLYWMQNPNLNFTQKQLLLLSLVLISFTWWQNFVRMDSGLAISRSIAKLATSLGETRSKTYVIISLWKCVIYLIILLFYVSERVPRSMLLQKDPFGEKIITITAKNMSRNDIHQFQNRMKTLEFNNFEVGLTYDVTSTTTKTPTTTTILTTTTTAASAMMEFEPFRRSSFQNKRPRRSFFDEDEVFDPFNAFNIHSNYIELNLFTSAYDALWIVFVHVVASIVCYHSAQFACKVRIQRIGFTVPLLLSVPSTVLFLHFTCFERKSDPCHATEFLTKELFWYCGQNLSYMDFFHSTEAIIWLLTFISLCWITVHLWTPGKERLMKNEKLFVLPYHIGFIIDQFLSLNRRQDDKVKLFSEDLEFDGTRSSGFSSSKLMPVLPKAQSSKGDTGLIREIASSADAVTKIYACATMWHESPLEMMCMLNSIFRLDEDQCARRNAQKYLKIIDPDYYEFEFHLIFDDAFEVNHYNELIINNYVKQFVEKVDEAASAVHHTQMRLTTPLKMNTPYGGRLIYTLPGKNRMIIHLKDKQRIRHRKRWSQVMYLYYLLGYSLMMKVEDESRKEIISENTFILTLDGDVDFTPQCVRLLVDLMKKNRRLGAACGRIHPRGSGLMIWYQKFEYAIGHWLQKATEHMIGCVLCSPGCFSLFRSFALMDDNVIKRYASKSEKPLDYIQYDQGEDRWLCTLLLERGYRVEYCAASDALTFAPEGFDEFFNQRRRWIPSTLANTIDLLQNYKMVVSVNESISIWYILYQCVMLMGSALGPGTIFLMIVGAVSVSVNISTGLAVFIVATPVAVFCLVCFCGDSKQQLLAAQFISALFASLMTAVIVGMSMQIQKDGVLSPHSIFLFAVIIGFFTAAVLHPLEFSCIIPGVIYFLAIPCTYMLLPIYGICNMNTVLWGTREEPKSPVKGTRKRKETIKVGSVDSKQEINGAIKIGCGNICQLLCCGDNENHPEQMRKIGEKLGEISDKLDTLNKGGNEGKVRNEIRLFEKRPESPSNERVVRGGVREVLEKRASRDLTKINTDAWLESKNFRRAQHIYLDIEEENFWKDLIERYLKPIVLDEKEQTRMQCGLDELRNRVAFGFFMVNIVFVLTVLLLQMQKDCIYIEWPLGPRFNRTFIPCHSDTHEQVWMISRLRLEPIGLVFLAFFVSILVIQFCAMLMHRIGTLAHIIASTELFCSKKRTNKLTEDDLVVQNAVEIARELQAIRGIDETCENADSIERPLSHRRVIQNLESCRKSLKEPKTETLDAAFKKRFFALSDDNFGERNRSDKKRTLRKNTIKAIAQRRDSIFGVEQVRAAVYDRKSDRFNSAPEEHTYERSNEERSQLYQGEIDTSRGINQYGLSRGPAQRRLEKIFDDHLRDFPTS